MNQEICPYLVRHSEDLKFYFEYNRRAVYFNMTTLMLCE